jgi:transposase
MAMGKRTSKQAPMFVAATELPVSPGHPFYAKLNTILDGAGFDRFAEEQCQRFYAPVMGRSSLPPGRYFRLLLVGYFEGLDSERGMAWRAADSLAVRTFVSRDPDTAAPDHSTISRTRRVIDVETLYRGATGHLSALYREGRRPTGLVGADRGAGGSAENGVPSTGSL